MSEELEAERDRILALIQAERDFHRYEADAAIPFGQSEFRHRGALSALNDLTDKLLAMWRRAKA